MLGGYCQTMLWRSQERRFCSRRRRRQTTTPLTRSSLFAIRCITPAFPADAARIEISMSSVCAMWQTRPRRHPGGVCCRCKRQGHRLLPTSACRTVKPSLQRPFAEPVTQRASLELSDELLSTSGQGIAEDETAWILTQRQQLCDAIGISATESYDKLIYQCLTKGGIKYRQQHLLPLCAEGSTDIYVRTLALRIHGDEVFVQSDVKREVVSELPKAAKAKATIPGPDSKRYISKASESIRPWVYAFLDVDSHDVAVEFAAKLVCAAELPSTEDELTWATQWLGPSLCALLTEWLQLYKQNRSIAVAATLKDDFGRSMMGYSENFCSVCDRMRTALLNGSCATIKFESLSPTGPASAKHLSAKLKCVFAPEAATCSVEVSPACDTLRNVWIHKSPQLFRPFDAPGVNSMLQRMLNKVSTDEAERSRVLGPGYEQLRVWMSGQDPPRVPQATTSVRGCRVANGCEDSSPGELPLKKRKTKA